MNYTVKILEKSWLTHNVILLVFEKPEGFTHKIGQAIELTLNTPQYRSQYAPFTLVSLPEEDQLKLIIKIYPKHHGLTEALSKINPKDSMIITSSWDSYEYQGKGCFIAAGSGITPFIPMFRDLNKNRQLKNHGLIYANRSVGDIILHEELTDQFKSHLHIILSEEKTTDFDYGIIDYNYLQSKVEGFGQHFYVCGPNAFMESVKKELLRSGAKKKNIQTGY
ncbi:FAD-binding oxidoreductase [Arenibacter sp. M-2]|uniref:FAD-binding oxidoreductase n=1 Tax=Arenibacter sp. M-2 TaxID=3053612 RepID=UPI0025700DDF|nr:FAD-binding oxidoreductase [Arenibacter sp. M-2]MDL5512023.1 FAD-binding oxidoreductase [Arenibacter sp. M-2]